MISGNMIGSYSQMGKTLVVTDESGNEFTGVIVDQEVIFDATDNDVREGKVYASDSGVSTGAKNIPAYHTYEGTRLITVNREFTIPNIDSNIDNYDYTKLQTIICLFNTNMTNSVSAEKVSIGDNVYDVQSTDPIATIIKNHESKSIDFGITNDFSVPCVIRYITYKEIE